MLITGGTGALGALVARHLVGQARTSGTCSSPRARAPPPRAPTPSSSELEAAGARVTVAACDVADRDALRQLLCPPSTRSTR